MTGWHWQPLMGFDLETTGLDVDEDRIVQVGFAEVPHPAKAKTRTIIVNPMVPIPKEASDIHGITDDIAITYGQDPAGVIESCESVLYAAWSMGQPVVVFNAAYDLSIFDRELRRYHGRGLNIEGPVIDPLVMINTLTAFKRTHNLEHCCEVYSIPLPKAHDAGEDALASTRLAWRLAEEIRVTVSPSDRGIVHDKHVKPDDPDMKIDVMQLGDVPLDHLQRMQLRWFRSSVQGFVDNQRSKGRDPQPNWQWPMIKKLEVVK